MCLAHHREEFFLIIPRAASPTASAKGEKILWQERLGTHHASLVSANGLVYFLNDGVMNVVAPGAVSTRGPNKMGGGPSFASHQQRTHVHPRRSICLRGAIMSREGRRRELQKTESACLCRALRSFAATVRQDGLQ
jgi:hypothetical protein